MAHVDAEHVGAGGEQLARSSRGWTRRARAWRRSWRGAGVSLLGAFLPAARPRAARWRRPAARGGVRCGDRRQTAGGCSALSVSCTVQERCSPVSTSKKPVRSIAARQAIVGAADGEFLLARAHEGVAGPFAAAVVIDRVDVIIARHQRAAQQRFAGARRHVPPAFGDPALGVLVAERDADPAAGVVAQPEIGQGRCADAAAARQQRVATRCSGAASEAMRSRWRVNRRIRVIGHGLSTTMARKSFTLVIGRAGAEQIPQRGEESGRIVVGKKGGGIEAERAGRAPRLSPSANAPAGSSASPAPPSVPSVSAARPRHAGMPASADRQRQRVFLVRAAAALPRMVTVNSPPERITARLPCARSVAGQPGVRLRDVARFALDDWRRAICIRSRRRAPPLPPRAARRPAAPPARSCRAGEHRIARLRRFHWPGRRARASPRPAASSLYLATIARASASVVGSGTVGPEPIADGSSPRHVGDGDRRHRRRIGVARQPAAFDAREMFAHGVDLADGGARAQQRARHRLLVFKRYAGGRRDPVGRGAARHQHQHEIVGPRAIGERRARGRRLAARPRREPDGRLRSWRRTAVGRP